MCIDVWRYGKNPYEGIYETSEQLTEVKNIARNQSQILEKYCQAIDRFILRNIEFDLIFTILDVKNIPYAEAFGGNTSFMNTIAQVYYLGGDETEGERRLRLEILRDIENPDSPQRMQEMMGEYMDEGRRLNDLSSHPINRFFGIEE